MLRTLVLRTLGIASGQKIVKWLISTLLVIGLTLGVLSCGKQGAPTIPGMTKPPSRLSEVAPPPAIPELRKVLDVHQPQVTILSPRSDEILQDTTVSVRLRVNDLPLFQDEELGLGPHLHFILDNQPYEAIYDASDPILLQDLTPGTHTIRVFASRPWHESFKNDGAYAQTTFHVFTKTPDNNPGSSQPLLTYSRPKGSYGAEPVMLDFYLANAPLHMVARESAEDDIVDWQIRCTVNGESFIFDRWEPIYLKGLRPGRNWVQLELLDEQGNSYNNPFNNTVRLIDYQPGGTDTLSQLVRGELSAIDVMRIVDPNYVPPEPEPEPEVTPIPEAETVPTPTLEPGDIPEVAPGQSIGEPDELTAPSVLEEPPTEASPAAPPELQADQAESDQFPTSVQPPSQPVVPAPIPPTVTEPPATPTLPETKIPETKMKEQLVDEVQEQLEELESVPSQETLTEELQGANLLAPLTQEALAPPIAPPDPLSPLEPDVVSDEKEKLLDRAKHFLDRVLPRPVEPSSIPSPAPIAPTTDSPAVTDPQDAVEIEETLDNPALLELLESPDRFEEQN